MKDTFKLIEEKAKHILLLNHTFPMKEIELLHEIVHICSQARDSILDEEDEIRYLKYGG